MERSMQVNMGNPHMNIRSMQRTRFLWCAVSSGGIAMLSSRTGTGFFRVDFPFKVPRSGPKICSAISMSSAVTGQFLMIFCLMMNLTLVNVGHPTLW